MRAAVRWLLLCALGAPVTRCQQQAEFSTEQLFQILAVELERQDSKPGERIIRFDEFQDTVELDCHQRLLYLLNITAQTRNSVREHHEQLTSMSGLYWQVLLRVPDESTWVWLVLDTQERILEKVHSYMARLAFLSLDRQQCLMSEVRRVLLGAVKVWKDIHGDLASLNWGGFAWGTLATHASRREVDPDLRNQSWATSLVAMNNWSSTTLLWFEQHTTDLFEAMVREEEASLQLDSADGARRLHHQDEAGMFVPLEYLRRVVFGQWALDKGLVRGLLKHIFLPEMGADFATLPTIGDFGAGGGQYCSWMNETGLVHAHAFDGTPKANEITNGAVQEVNLVQDLRLWTDFDWVMSLEVGEHVPKEFSESLVRNLRRHTRKGLIMSWSDDWEGIGHVNCLSQEAFIAFIEDQTDLRIDRATTQLIKDSCEIDYIARTVAVFRAP